MRNQNLGLRAPFHTGHDTYFISQKALENIGIIISSCPLCKEIHRLAKMEREHSTHGDWQIITHNKDLADHVLLIAKDERCPTVDTSNKGVIDDPLEA